MNAELNELLSRPLPDVPDQGFSARVMAKIARQEMRQARIDALSWIALVLAATGALALTRVGREFAAFALSLNAAMELGIALSVILLVFVGRASEAE